MVSQAGLPPGAQFVEGQLVRIVTLPGTRRRVYRPVALSLEEAREKGYDFYSTVHQSWVRGGRKLEKEHELPAPNVGLAGSVSPHGLSLPPLDDEEEVPEEEEN